MVAPLKPLKTKSRSKVVLITGASRGIGHATSKHLADRGYIVYGGDISPYGSASHKNINFHILDVTNTSSVEEFVNKIIKKEGRIDVLINNAAKRLVGPVEALTIDEIKDLMDVNFFGAIRLCQTVLPHMRQQKNGHIINISSMLGVHGAPYGSLYTSSKAAVESLSEALSIELLPWNIAVSIVEPGHVSTNFSIKMGSKKIKNSPYQSVIDILIEAFDREKKPPKSETPKQTPEAVAKFLAKVIESKNPKLRYQTSKEAKDLVSIKLKDLSGKDFMKSMKADWQETYFPKEAKKR